MYDSTAEREQFVRLVLFPFLGGFRFASQETQVRIKRNQLIGFLIPSYLRQTRPLRVQQHYAPSTFARRCFHVREIGIYDGSGPASVSRHCLLGSSVGLFIIHELVIRVLTPIVPFPRIKTVKLFFSFRDQPPN